MIYFQKEKLFNYLLINNYYRNPFEILKKFLNLEKNINFLLYFKKNLIVNCLDVLRFHKLYLHILINPLNSIHIKTISIIENLRLEITLNTYKLTRIKKIQLINPLVILQKNSKKINYSEKIYILKIFKLINYYIIKNLIFILPINFIRFKKNIFNFIKIIRVLQKSKSRFLICQINKNFKFLLISKSKILYSCYSFHSSLLLNLQYIKNFLCTFISL